MTLCCYHHHFQFPKQANGAAIIFPGISDGGIHNTNEIFLSKISKLCSRTYKWKLSVDRRTEYHSLQAWFTLGFFRLTSKRILRNPRLVRAGLRQTTSTYATRRSYEGSRQVSLPSWGKSFHKRVREYDMRKSIDVARVADVPSLTRYCVSNQESSPECHLWSHSTFWFFVAHHI